MGEYFIAAILSATGEIIAWFHPHDYGSSMDYVCHFFVGDPLMNAIDAYLYEQCETPLRVIWVSDYAPKEPNSDLSMYDRCMQDQAKRTVIRNQPPAKRRLINHTQNWSGDLVEGEDAIHPLPISCMIGESCSSADYTKVRDLFTVDQVQ
jgi:hypothetical protein